jgi:predicted transcriptional regulator
LKLFHQTQPDSSTAFRLPKELLETIDLLCDDLDLTRSQVLRRSITEYLKVHGYERRELVGSANTEEHNNKGERNGTEKL